MIHRLVLLLLVKYNLYTLQDRLNDIFVTCQINSSFCKNMKIQAKKMSSNEIKYGILSDQKHICVDINYIIFVYNSFII